VSAALLSSTLLLTGCGTGLKATTYTIERSPRDFRSTGIADLEVRNLGIAGPSTGITIPASSTAVLTGTVVNTGHSDDSVVGVETDVAGTATMWLNGKPVTEVPVPAGGDTGQWSVTLSDLKQDLRVGQYLDVTLVFAHAGRLADLQVPVRTPADTGLDQRTPEQDPYKSAE
jgi:copper(I)-binding protein